MKQTTLKKFAAVLLALVLAVQMTLPTAAFAEQRAVELDNHTAQSDQATLVEGITIGGVDKPATGEQLDITAAVTTAGDAAWEIPTIWVRDDLQIDADDADEGHTYLPALAFFVPQGYELKQDTFTVTLDDGLTELFGTNEIISVYDEATGITYIIPATLKDLFARSADTAVPAPEQEQAEDEEPTTGLGDGQSEVELYCSKTARDALTDEDLQWLIDLIKDYLQPQAVNLLIKSFPCFSDAAKNGGIGKEIGLYIYYKKGDDDGDRFHQASEGAMAFVHGNVNKIDDELKYCYMLAIDVDSFLKKDRNGKPIRDKKTGRYTLVRKGDPITTLENTMVHEMLHVLMHDYNRTGMSGATDLKDLLTDSDWRFLTKEAGDRNDALQFPQWFMEGTASAVENVYSLRYSSFHDLRRLEGKNGYYGSGKLNYIYTTQLIKENYCNGRDKNSNPLYYDLSYAQGGKDANGNEIDTENSRYVMGYLATLYLSELAVRYNTDNKDSSVKYVWNRPVVDPSKLRDGMNSLLKWTHDGYTLDRVVGMLAPKDASGQSSFKNTEEFEKMFLKGKQAADGKYAGDEDSLKFVNELLNYFLSTDYGMPDDVTVNGSILKDFKEEYKSPLDSSKKESSDYLKIINSNTMVPSTVSPDTANIGAGKSDPDQATASANANESTDVSPQPIAAKVDTTVEPAEPQDDQAAEPQDEQPVAEANEIPEGDVA